MPPAPSARPGHSGGVRPGSNSQRTWLPIGIGVHTGRAFVGVVKGGAEGMSDFTMLGDDVNVTARLASAAAAGEIIISEAAYIAGGRDLGELEHRRLQLKGKSAEVEVRVLTRAFALKPLMNADVIIIGAGVQGASLAFHLAQRGVKVLVLEKRFVAAGATGRSSGLVRMHYDVPQDTQLAWLSFQYFRDWKNKVGGECGFTRTGFLQLVAPDDVASAQGQCRRAPGQSASPWN